MALLEVNNIHAYYGNIQALKGVTLSVDQGEVVSLIGGKRCGQDDDFAHHQRVDAAAYRFDHAQRRGSTQLCAP